jgi:long-chain acyl-CoA synthetase
LLFAFNRLVLSAYFGLRAEGLEHVPSHGPFVITPNHVSYLDPLTVAAALPYRLLRRVYWAGDLVRLFSNPLSRFFCRIVHVFPVDKYSPRSAIDSAARVLERGDVQVWFPEGWRSPDGATQEFMPGIGVLLSESGAPAVPAFIAGTFEALPRGRRWPRRRRITILFGPPVTADGLAGGAEAEVRRVADALRDRVARLAPERGGQGSP